MDVQRGAGPRGLRSIREDGVQRGHGMDDGRISRTCDPTWGMFGTHIFVLCAAVCSAM